MPLNKDVGNWIKDFMKSNAPQFKGKSKEERKDMALAAYREKYGSLEEDMGVDYMKIIDLVKSADNPQNLSVYYNSDHNKVNIGGTGYDKGDLVKMFKLQPGQSSDVKALFYKANQYAEDVVNAINNEKAGVKAQLKYGYGKEPFVTYKMVNSVEETKSAPDGHYFTKSGNLVKGRLTKDARERGATKSDPKDKMRSKIPPVTQYNEDLDLGHQDDEPHMLKKDLYDIIDYASKLYKQLDKYDKMDGEVDFPHWWQSKVIKARDYISKAQHYLEFEENEPAIDATIAEKKGKDHDGDGDIDSDDYLAARDKAIKKAMGKIKEIVKVKTPEEAAKVSKENPDAEVEVVSEVLTEGHKYDYEGKMAQSQLLSIVKNARDLFNMMDEKTQLKSWVQSKLTKAEDYLDAVRTYLEGEALSSTVPAMFENDRVSDETGTALSIGYVVKGGDGKIYQIVFSASEGKPSLVPFDLKRRKITTLRNKVYFDDQESSVPKKLNKVMDFSATKGGFMN